MPAAPGVAAGLLLLLTGCASGGPVAPPASSTAAASVTTSVPPSPGRTPSSSPTPTPAPRTAADGTDLSACEDGVCEVRVDGPAEIPVPRDGGLSEVRVEVTDDGPRLVVVGSSGSRGRIGGSGRVSLAGGGVVTMEAVDRDSVIVTVNVDAG